MRMRTGEGDATAEGQLLILGEDSLDLRTVAAVASREFRGETRMSDGAAELQLGLAEYHPVGAGPPTPPEVVRATMLIRANCWGGVR